MIGFTSSFANVIKEIFSKYTPIIYQEVFYKILKESMLNSSSLYYTWYNEDGEYEELQKNLIENGFDVKVAYEDDKAKDLIITWDENSND